EVKKKRGNQSHHNHYAPDRSQDPHRQHAPIPPELDTPAFRAAWAEYLKFREEYEPSWGEYTHSDQQRALKGLVAFGEAGAMESLRLGMSGPYRGLCPPGTRPLARGQKQVATPRETEAQRFERVERECAARRQEELTRAKNAVDLRPMIDEMRRKFGL